MTKTRFLALLTALALLLAIPTAAFAQNTIPHLFIGSATLDGATAVDGTAVTAWVNGEQVEATNVTGGRYSMQVGGAAGFAGQTVVFRVGAADAAESAEWVMGEATELRLREHAVPGLRRQLPHGSGLRTRHVHGHGRVRLRAGRLRTGTAPGLRR